MRGLSGYGVLIDPLMPAKERDTFTCGHCNRIRHVEPMGRGFLAPVGEDGKFKQHEYVRCGHCDTLICEMCVGKECTPFMEKLKDYEIRMARLREYELNK